MLAKKQILGLPCWGVAALTAYNKNSLKVGAEFANTSLWNAANLGLSYPGQVDVTLTRNPSGTYDRSNMRMSVLGGSASTIVGYPQWVWGNAYTYGGVLGVTPTKVSDLTSLFVYLDTAYSGNGQFNGLLETMLTDVPVSPGVDGAKQLELAVMWRIPEVTKQFIYAAPYTNLGGYVDAYGRSWSLAFKAGSGVSALGYAIFYPSDMEDRLITEFDFRAMAAFAIAKIAGASTAWYINGIQHGMEPLGSSGSNVVTRNRWIRDFNNSPFSAPAAVKENIAPNTRLLSAYGFSPTGNFSIPGDGTMTISGSAQFNASWCPCPLQDGVTYNVSFDITAYSAGGARVDLTNGSSGVVLGTARTANGSYSQQMVATATTNAIRVTATGASTNTLKVSNIRVVPA